MEFEGPASESDEVGVFISHVIAEALKMILRADTVEQRVGWVCLETQVKVSVDPRMIFGWR